MWLWMSKQPTPFQEPILHFAAEKGLKKFFQAKYKNYKTADISYDADYQLDIQDTRLESGSFGTIICNHVLEHVPDDLKAMRELCRILVKGGKLFASVPMIHAWSSSYENPRITSEQDRLVHFGQEDHVRYYGRDFPERIMKSGFSKCEEIIASGEDAIRYGLTRGEVLYCFTK
jgi:SAM-dependent methyltransferase